MRDDADARAKVLKMLRSASAVTPAAHDYDVHVHVRSGDIFAVHDQTHLRAAARVVLRGRDRRAPRLAPPADPRRGRPQPVVGALLRRYAGRADWDKQLAERGRGGRNRGAEDRLRPGHVRAGAPHAQSAPRALRPHRLRCDRPALRLHASVSTWPRPENYFRAVFPMAHDSLGPAASTAEPSGPSAASAPGRGGRRPAPCPCGAGARAAGLERP